MTQILDAAMPGTGTGTVSLADLTPTQQTGWYQFQEVVADDNLTSDQYPRLHRTAAPFLGVDLPANGELVRCDCPTCGDDCDAIGNRDTFGAYDGHPLCLDCADHTPSDD